MPDGRFETAYIKQQYVSNFGTQYIDALNGTAFHVNKTNDDGNTLLHIAAQNGRLKVVDLLMKKGANANHQNVLGNTPMHFALAYKFVDLAAWLADGEKGGAVSRAAAGAETTRRARAESLSLPSLPPFPPLQDDTIQNLLGLTPYDGID